MRDEFSANTIRTLAQRVGHRCSNPECMRATSGPAQDEDGYINVGIAAHITAASPGGPRYDASLTAATRRSASNGIWLCQVCAKLIDSDILRFPADTLRKWKQDAIESGFTAIATAWSGIHAQAPSIVQLDEADREFLRSLALPAEDDVELVTKRMLEATAHDIAAFRGAKEWPSYTLSLHLTLQATDGRHSVTLDGVANGIGVSEGVSIVAPPGTGKTTTLVQLVDNILSAGHIVPALVPLGEWSARLEDFFSFLNRRNAFRAYRPQHFMQLAYHGRLILLLDGWNELDPASRLKLCAARATATGWKSAATSFPKAVRCPVPGPRRPAVWREIFPAAPAVRRSAGS